MTSSSLNKLNLQLDLHFSLPLHLLHPPPILSLFNCTSFFRKASPPHSSASTSLLRLYLLSSLYTLAVISLLHNHLHFCSCPCLILLPINISSCSFLLSMVMVLYIDVFVYSFVDCCIDDSFFIVVFALFVIIILYILECVDFVLQCQYSTCYALSTYQHICF